MIYFNFLNTKRFFFFSFFSYLIFFNFNFFFFFKTINKNLIYYFLNNFNYFYLFTYNNLNYKSYFFFKKNSFYNLNKRVFFKKIDYFIFEKDLFKNNLNNSFKNYFFYKNWYNLLIYKNYLNFSLDIFFQNFIKYTNKFKFFKKASLSENNPYCKKNVNLKNIIFFFKISTKPVFRVNNCPGRLIYTIFFPNLYKYSYIYGKNLFICQGEELKKRVIILKKITSYLFIKNKFINLFKNFNFYKNPFLFKKLGATKQLFWFFFFNFYSNQVYLNLFYNFSEVNEINKKKIFLPLIRQIHKSRLPVYFYFLNYFFKNFFEYFFNQKIQINFFFFKSLSNYLKKKNFFKLTTIKLKKFQSIIGKGFFLEETLEAIWLTLLLKDSFFFLNWLKKTMKRIYFKHHRKFLNFLKLIFLKVFSKIFFFFNCLGFYFLIKGKIGVTGNAKKRKFSFSSKTYSLTKKSNKLAFYKTSVTTHTGALGVKFLLVFY